MKTKGMRLTLNEQATEQFLELMKLMNIESPSFAINRLVSKIHTAVQYKELKLDQYSPTQR